MCAAPESHGAARAGFCARCKKNPWHSSNGPVAGPLALCPRETAAATGRGIERGRGALGAGRPFRCRARGSFHCAPRIPAGKPGRAILARPWRAGASLRPPRPCLRGPLGGRCGPSRAACWRWSLAVRAVGVCCGCSSWCSAGSGGVAGGSGGAAWWRGAVAAWRGGGGGAAAVGGAGGVAAVAGLRRLRAGVGRRRRLGRGLRCGAALFGALSLLSAPRTETHHSGTQHREPKLTPSGRSIEARNPPLRDAATLRPGLRTRRYPCE